MKAKNSIFFRKVSPIERIFIALDKIDTPFAIQMVLEGTGTLDESRWKKAVNKACEANPGSRLVYRGSSRWARWVDTGVAPPVRIFDGSDWSAHGPEGASFLYDPLPFKETHSCEVALVQGDPVRVVFRTFHAVMDGRGTLFWVEDVFRALRGEPLIGSSSTMTDVELVSLLDYPVKRQHRPKNCPAPTGPVDGDEAGQTWRRASVQGRFSKLIPQVAVLTAKETRKQGQGDVYFNVPVDLRSRMPNIRSTANLTRRIILNIPPEATVESVQREMMGKLDNLRGDSQLLKAFCYTPLGWLEKSMNFAMKRTLRDGLYRGTGTITNVGKLPMSTLRGGGFEAQSGFIIPPGTDSKPVFMTLSGLGDSIDIVIAMPKMLATNGRLDELLSNIVSGLKPN
ncbi:hypothetical protein ACFL4G_00975 [Thermodesulfobacteriota bacterium]